MAQALITSSTEGVAAGAALGAGPTEAPSTFGGTIVAVLVSALTRWESASSTFTRFGSLVSNPSPSGALRFRAWPSLVPAADDTVVTAADAAA